MGWVPTMVDTNRDAACLGLGPVFVALDEAWRRAAGSAELPFRCLARVPRERRWSVEYGAASQAEQMPLPSGALLELGRLGPRLLRAEGSITPEALRALLQWILVLALRPWFGFVVHATALAGRQDQEDAELFFGPSGAGKTTLARHAAGEVLAEENVIVWREGSAWWVSGTPWWSNGGWPGQPLRRRLRLVAGLTQSHHNRLLPRRAAQLLPRLAEQIYCPLGGVDAEQQRALLRLLGEVRLGELEFTKGYRHAL